MPTEYVRGLIPGSTPARRHAGESLSPEGKDEVKQRLRIAAKKAGTEYAKLKSTPKDTRPGAYSIPLHNTHLSIKGDDRDIRYPIAYYDVEGARRVLYPALTDVESSAITSQVDRRSSTTSKMIYAPIKKGAARWTRMNTVWRPTSGDETRMFLKSSYVPKPPPPVCPAWGCSGPPALCDPSPCQATDSDGDGIPDLLESQLADAFTPAYHVSANENPGTGFATFQDSAPETVLASYAPTPPISYYRVEPSDFIELTLDQNRHSVYHRYFRIDYLTLWNKDDGLVAGLSCAAGLGVSLDDIYGFTQAVCGVDASLIVPGLQSHSLDHEHSAVLLAVQVSGLLDNKTVPLDYTQYFAIKYFAAAHENTAVDRSSTYVPPAPLPVNSHLDLYLSRSKHSTYFANPDGYPIVLNNGQLDALEAAAFGVYYISSLSYYGICPVDDGFVEFLPFPPYYYVVYQDAYGGCYYDDYYPDLGRDAALAYLIDVLFTDCLGEHFTEQGVSFANNRINVGEPDAPLKPTTGNHFIQDTLPDYTGSKLREPIFPEKHL